jgi:endoglucanase
MITANAVTADPLPRASERACDVRADVGVPASRLATLAHGFNLPGWLDSRAPQRPDLSALIGLHARGFSHIRLPVRAEYLLDAFSGRNDIVQYLGELDRALDDLGGIGFGVTVDAHPGERFNRLHVADPDGGFRLLEELWRLLARRYASRSPERLFFEPLNEPVVHRNIWRVQGPRLVNVVRQAAPAHTIIFGHADYQRIDALSNLTPLADANVVYATHFYEPMIFTHQGQDWSDDPLRYLERVPFPARLDDPAIAILLDNLSKHGQAAAAALLRSQLRKPWTESRIADDISQAAAWAERNRRPVMINEFGVLGWKAAATDRARWLRTVRSAAEQHCLGWTHWDYADGFGFVKRIAGREMPDELILDALLPVRR